MVKLDERLIEKTVELVNRGWSAEAICRKLVVNPTAFANWARWGWDILAENENDEQLALRAIREDASRRDKHTFDLYVKFTCRVQAAIGEQVGQVEEVAYSGAMNDSKAAMQWLGIRAHKTWGKKDAPLVKIESHPIKQIVVHSHKEIEPSEEVICIGEGFADE